MPTTHSPQVDFDDYAIGYASALARGLSVSGESQDYFARGRVSHVAACLRQLDIHAHSVLDFGCGIGTTTPLLLEYLNVDAVIGTDESASAVVLAKERFGSARARFLSRDEWKPQEDIDLAYCNGVFHHILPEKRLAALQCIHRSLRPNGLFAFWENNPWNPGTRYVMSRIPFDRDAVLLSAPSARNLLQEGGFETIHTSFLFVFPRLLRWGRPLEKWLTKAPLGAQYMVLCRRR